MRRRNAAVERPARPAWNLPANPLQAGFALNQSIVMLFLRLYLRVLGQLGSDGKLAAVLVIANLALAGALFAEPVLFGRIIDQLAADRDASRIPSFLELAPLAGAWVGFGVFTIVAGGLIALYSDRLAHSRRLLVMANYFEHVLHLPLSFHGSTHSGRLLKIMLEGSGGMANLWLSFFRDNCASFVALFIVLPFALLINWRLALVLFVLIIVFGAVTTFVLLHTYGMQSEVERYNSDFAERASDALGNVPVIQSFTRVGAETTAMAQISKNLLDAQWPVLSWWAATSVITHSSSTLAVLGIFMVGVWLNIQGLATIGEIVTFVSIARMLISRLEQIVGFINLVFQQSGKLREFFEVLDTMPGIADRPGATDPGRLGGQVAFEDVSFAYDTKRTAISHVSFTAVKGDTIALVGATGSGKSTTLSLLHRIFDPHAGRITIDGQDVRNLSLIALRRNIGVVFQEPMLFARSIEDNLRIGKPDATAAEIALALERAQASEFIARQSHGLATLVGERGRALSGGERQRLAIARALLKDPPIMIFDEATSALDATTERQLQAALEAATAGRTTFVIAHRLSTIRNATRILVFDHGKVVESGGFDELVAKDGVFAKLARAQFMAAEAKVL